MARLRTPGGEWWTVYVDVAGPRLRWRPLEWWQARKANGAPPVEDRDGQPFRRPADAIGQHSHRYSQQRDVADRRQREARWWDFVLDGLLVDTEIPLMIAGVVAALVFLAMLLGLVVLPVLVVVIDALLIVVGAAALFVWRTATRAGWHVIAHSDDGVERRWHADGWFAARRTRRAIDDALSSGSPIVTPDATEVSSG